MLLLSLALPVLGAAARPAAPPLGEGRPHVVLVLADDLGIGDPGCYQSGSKIPTPHIDRLADEGLRLRDAHSPSGVCTPTRYGILTGRYAWRGGLKQGVLWSDSPCLIEPERATLAERLAGVGYHTLAIGKWHLGLGTSDPVDWEAALRPGPLEHGFARFFGIAGSLDMAPYVYLSGHGLEQRASERIEQSLPRRWGGEGFWREGPIAPDFRHEQVLDRLVQEAGAEFERALEEDPERPVFLYLSLTAPHTPWVPTKPFQGKSGAGWYGDFVVQVDDVVGRVLALLERLEIAERTLLVFTSDNGAHWEASDVERYGHRANGPFRGQKGDIQEGGHRVPFLARWPGRIPAGAVRDELLGLQDLWATLAAIAGAEPLQDKREGEDSLDQSALLLGEELEEPIRHELVLHSYDGMFALRSGPWKLVEGQGSGGFTDPSWRAPEPGEPPGCLYHLDRDPGEERNLWDEEPEVVARLRSRLDVIRTGSGASGR